MSLTYRIALALIACSAALVIQSQPLVPLPEGAYFEPFRPHLSASNQELILREGDRLAICGDSITEQKMYSRIIETYLTVCVPDLRVSVRQFGWSGERAPGFLSRMTNDVLRFRPTIATTCYGMNDHRYQPFTAEIGDVYSQSSRAIIQAFKSHGVRVVQGSAGTVGKMPSWVKSAQGDVLDLNLGLLELRNIDVQLAREENVYFADVFLPMLIQGYAAQQTYGSNYMITGKDGVHPGWAGQVVMAYSFLNAFGLDGNLGQITIDLKNQSASATGGHEIKEMLDGQITLSSRQYPFCATGALGDDSSMRSGMEWVPFMDALNRLILKIENPSSANYRVYWGEFEKVYSSESLSQGVNLAADFVENPFSEAFNKVDQAVAAKQAYETRQIKQIFHGPEGRTDAEMAAALTEKTREPLVRAIRNAFKPVIHTIRLVSE